MFLLERAFWTIRTQYRAREDTRSATAETEERGGACLDLLPLRRGALIERRHYAPRSDHARVCSPANARLECDPAWGRGHVLGEGQRTPPRSVTIWSVAIRVACARIAHTYTCPAHPSDRRLPMSWFRATAKILNVREHAAPSLADTLSSSCASTQPTCRLCYPVTLRGTWAFCSKLRDSSAIAVSRIAGHRFECARRAFVKKRRENDLSFVCFF